MTGDAPSTTVNVPGPTAEETELQRTQIDILTRQQELSEQFASQQALLQPFLFEDIGLETIRDEAGNIVGFERAPDEFAEQRTEIEGLLLDRTQAALVGELPLDPALLRSLDEEEASLRDRLRRQLGPGFETSTPGIQAIAEFTKRSEEIKAGARRADLSLSEQLGLAREGSNQNRIDAFINRALGVSGSAADPIAALSGTAQGFQSPLSNFAQQRNLQFQGNLASAQLGQQAFATKQQFLGDLFSGVGQAAGTFAGLKAG